MLYDVFISHASEDKESFVQVLAESLEKKHIKVWYDELSLKPGDSLRRAIDNGLKQSRYGIVILSPSFFKKEWTQWELDGLVQRQNSEKAKLLIPIWYKTSHSDVIEFSPSLADKIAIDASKGMNYVVDKVISVVKPHGSTLIIARDKLLNYGLDCPVVTDDWWLDIAEFSACNPMEGTFQEGMGWGWWGFPLPNKGCTHPEERAERLAWAAMQKNWQDEAERLRITQISSPEEVLDFIESMPGLSEASHQSLHYLLAYVPQLAIKGCGGQFEEEIAHWYKVAVRRKKKAELSGTDFGTALTVDESPTDFGEPVAFRSRDFLKFKPSHMACWFVQGEINGPEAKFYHTIDYAVWLLSDDSYWMPKRIREFLLQGLRDWGQWSWSKYDYQNYDNYLKFEINSKTGALQNALLNAKNFNQLQIKQRIIDDIDSRFAFSVELMGLHNSPEELRERFLNSSFIEGWFLTRN